MGISSLVVTRNLITEADFLSKIAANPSQLAPGAFFIFLMGFSLAAIPVFLYSLFKKKNEALALGMVVFRGPIEGDTYILLVVNWLLLGVFSKELTPVGAATPSLNVIGNVLLQANNIINPVGDYCFIIGAMLFTPSSTSPILSSDGCPAGD